MGNASLPLARRRWGLLVLLLQAACAAGTDTGAGVVVRDSAGIAIVENDVVGRTEVCSVGAAPAVAIGAADAGPDYELYRVFGASRLSDGRIALVNQGSQQLRFYDAQGRFERAAGRAGRGPGEFSNAFYLWVLPADTVWVGDYDPWQFLVFSPEGEWVRTVRAAPVYPNSPATINVLDDGRAVLGQEAFAPYGPRFEPRSFTIVVHAADGALTDTVGTYENGRWGRVGEAPNSPGLYPLFESFTRADAAGSRLVVGHGSVAELAIHALDAAPRLARIVRWTAGPREISDADVAAERERLAAQYPDLSPEMRRVLVDPLVSEERPVAERFPAFQSVMLGRDGRIWVRQPTRPTDPQSGQWLAFDADGRFVCRATLPSFRNFYEFGEDYLLALDPDELGVERVVLYELTGPAQ